MKKIPYCLPANISAEQFLDEYWQKKPLLIKNGLPSLVGMFEPDDIISLAQMEDVTARLIWQQGKQWFIKTNTDGPFNQQTFSNLPKLWTVLIQNMEQWSQDLALLWHAFDFIPQWQRDDIMVSYAPKGGSVGKHFDRYDVFLAQGFGARRWQLGKYCDHTTAFVQGQPIRILDDMGELIFDEVLQAGDVLYVPSHLSHFGVAENDCLTFSFGFRRPNPSQLLDNFLDVCTQDERLALPFAVHQPLHGAGKLHQHSLDDIKRQLRQLLNDPTYDDLLTQAIAETVSRRQYELLLPEACLNFDEFCQAMADGAKIYQDLSSKIVYLDDGLSVFVNGETLGDEVGFSAKQLLIKLADGHGVSQQDLDQSAVSLIEVYEWLENGWIYLENAWMYLEWVR